MSKDKAKQRGASRRKFIQGTAAVAAGATVFGVRAQPMKPPAPPRHFERDLVLVNGRIHTMDAENRVVSSVAIQNGRFVALGTGRGLPVAMSREARVIDLGGRSVVPGIIDNHNHRVLMGNRPGYHTPLENAYSIADVQQTYAARAKEIPNGAWITTIGGFHSNHIYGVPGNKASGRLPTLAELDVVPNPVFMMVSFTGPGATNTAGRDILMKQGVTVGADGSLGGGFPTSECTKALLYLRQTLLNPAERRRAAVDAMKYAASLGVTTHIDQGAFQAVNTPADGAAHEDNFTMHLPFLELYDQDVRMVRLRINFLHMEADQATPELEQRLKNAFPFIGDEWVKTGGIGEFIAQGTNAASPFLAAARRVAKAGWRAEVHSLGRRASATSAAPDFEQEISAFETVNAEFDGVVGKKRWVVAHVPGITQEWINRLKAIGGGLSLTGWQYLAGSIPAVSVTPFAGPPFRWIVDSGIHAGMSSDGMQIAPMNPWIHMYFATTGTNARGVMINPGQTITRQEVLGLYTSANGWFVREENDLGSIEVGKLADLVVLNSDYFSVPSEDLKQIRSVLTVVGGNIVHDTGAVG